MKIPESDEKGSVEQGLKAAASALLNTRSYKTPEPGMCLVSIDALAALASAMDNPALAGTIRSTGKNREAQAAAIAETTEVA